MARRKRRTTLTKKHHIKRHCTKRKSHSKKAKHELKITVHHKY